jgi:hypothetical protein
MINTKENKRIARTPIRTTNGLSVARIPVNGTLNKAKPARMQKKYKKGLLSNTLIVFLTPFRGLLNRIHQRCKIVTTIINRDKDTMDLEYYS